MEKECLAVVLAVTKVFHAYLYGTKFHFRTDNQPLTSLKTLKDPPMRIARWILKLQEYAFTIEHRSGRKPINAYSLSRHPIRTIEFSNTDSVENLKKQHADTSLKPILDFLLQRIEFPPEKQMSR